MKNKKTYILALAMLTTIVSNANGNLTSDPVDNINKTTITLNNVKQGNQLLIKDSHGVVIYKETIKTAGTYSKGFDLRALPDGHYSFELEKDIEIKSIPFKVDAKNVILNNEEPTIYKPFVTSKNDCIYLTKLALNNEPLDVKIYNDNEELIYSEEIKNTKTIEKAYKLSSKGNYKIVLSSNGRAYYEYIKL